MTSDDPAGFVPASHVGAVRSAGLFGGTFDPPHLAHLALARAALEQLTLARVLWVPAGDPWQKPEAHPAPARDRKAMVQLMIEAEPRFEVDERELRRAGPSYTIDTLRELHAEHPGTAWWLLLGQDQLERFTSWRDWPAIAEVAGLAVAARAGGSQAAAPGLAGCPHRLSMLRMALLPHASTEVRAGLSSGEDVSSLVGAPVARYIARHHLYRNA